MTVARQTASDPEELRRLADEIVRRPEFREEPPSLLRRALDWTLDRLGDSVIPSGGSSGYVIGYGLLILALGLVGYLLWRVFPRGQLLPPRDTFTIDTATAVRKSRQEWLADAAEAEAAGDWERAVHARYHALAVGLADGHHVPAEPSTTSGERRNAYTTPPHEPAQVAMFGDATDTYEQVWFGDRGAAQPQSRQLAEADRSLLDGGVS